MPLKALLSSDIELARFISTFRESPDLSFEVKMEKLNTARLEHRIVIAARGALTARIEWEHRFDEWCAMQGQVPKFRRGNQLTSSTVGYVVFPGAHPIIEFIIRWVGLDALCLDVTLPGRVTRIERQLSSMRMRDSLSGLSREAQTSAELA